MDFQATEDKVKVLGRTIFREGVRYLGYSATSISFTFTGREARVLILSDPEQWPVEHHAWIGVFVNHEEIPSKRIELKKLRQDILLYQSRQEETVTITIMKFSEPEYAICGIESLHIDTDLLLPPPAPKSRRIQIVGDSITCGYGVEGSPEDTLHNTAVENPIKAYSVKTARALDADLEIVAWNGKGIVSAYIGDEDQADDSWLVPMLYEYTDAGCCQQFFHEPPSLWESWDHSRFEPDLVTLFLGTNDASYTKNYPERKKGFSLMYQSFLRKIHQRHPQAKILCMLGTMDQSLCATTSHAVKEFTKSCPQATVKYLQLPLQDERADGTGTFWHPTEATQEKIAQLVIDAAQKMMNWE